MASEHRVPALPRTSQATCFCAYFPPAVGSGPDASHSQNFAGVVRHSSSKLLCEHHSFALSFLLRTFLASPVVQGQMENDSKKKINHYFGAIGATKSPHPARTALPRAKRVRRVRSASMAASPRPRSLTGSQQIPSHFFPRRMGAPQAALRAHAGTCVQEKPSLQQGARAEKVPLAVALGRVRAAPSAALGTGPLLPRHFSSARNWKPFRGTLSSFDFNTALSF